MTVVHHAGGKGSANTYLVNILLPNRVEMYQVKVAEGEIIGSADALIGMDIISKGDFAVTNFNSEAPRLQGGASKKI